MKEVQLNIDNYTKCLCPVCPVQAKSQCILTKKQVWKEFRTVVGKVMEEYPAHPEDYGMNMSELENNATGEKNDFHKPQPEEMMELYCSKAVGGSNCSDLDSNSPCQCPTCAVWGKHELNGTYYCLRR